MLDINLIVGTKTDKTYLPKDYLLVEGERDKNSTNMLILNSGKFYKENKIGQSDKRTGVNTYFRPLLLKLSVVCL